MKKEILQDIIQTLRMRRGQALSNSKECSLAVMAKYYWIGVSMGYDSSMNLIKEYLKQEEGKEDDKK